MFDSIKIQFCCFSMKYQWWYQTFGHYMYSNRLIVNRLFVIDTKVLNTLSGRAYVTKVERLKISSSLF